MANSHMQIISSMLDEAEQKQTCAWTNTKALQDSFVHCKARGNIISPAPSLYVRKDQWNQLSFNNKHLYIARALTEKHPNWVFCGPTAALAYGFEVPYWQLQKIHVTHLKSCYRENQYICHHRYIPRMKNSLQHPYIAAGIPVLSAAETLTQCLRMSNFADGLCIADSGLRALNQTREWLLNEVNHVGFRQKRIAQAKITASFADARAESGGESIARAHILELGFALPELQATIIDPISQATYRVDFLWTLSTGQRIIGELDGQQKYVDPDMTQGRSAIDVLTAERLRESRLSRLASIMRFSFANACDLAFLYRLLQSFGVPRALQPFITWS
ncbi:hypothetical protein [uncultured Olegusella sp.]|uniref:hypothetical protein n=1 Tax=uncultured Olegusella sp. TaxID=1979846 RepID=UPI002607D482|nr:hypothetical protein [uncultured Olegusella sp.]